MKKSKVLIAFAAVTLFASAIALMPTVVMGEPPKVKQQPMMPMQVKPKADTSCSPCPAAACCVGEGDVDASRKLFVGGSREEPPAAPAAGQQAVTPPSRKLGEKQRGATGGTTDTGVVKGHPWK